MPEMPTRWLIVGSGRCGVQLARSMLAAGVPVAGVAVRSGRGSARVRRLLPGVRPVPPAAPLPQADAVLIAVPDGALSGCARELAKRLPPGVRVALHTSGLYPGTVLSRLRQRGIAIGSFHPLMVFPASGGPRVALAGAVAAVEGDPAASRTGLQLAAALGMSGRRLRTSDKPVYHAAAVLAANLTHVLVAEARALLVGIGFSRGEAARALAPLIARSVAAALSASGLERLTGPLSRGDAGAVAAHLRRLDDPLAAAYRAVSRLALARMERDGAPNAVAKSALDSVLRALTTDWACASVPADESD